jgi:aspartyl-tRNA(Asn)/glutamyl-tRNA(Gln) amidotransferase subunit A
VGEARSSAGIPDTIAALARAFGEGELSPVDVVRVLLERIGEDETNAFVTVTGERALGEAKRAEREMAAGLHRGPLHGIPVALKDLIYTLGVRTTMGSAFFEGHVPDRDAAVVDKLAEAGAVIVGKTNTHEFAYGTTGDRSRFGPTRNPCDLARITGGSSGGSGAAVAAGLAYGSLGSDTGGSIRIPAALCGAVGMKPTFGRVSKRGVFPLAWTLDHVGPLARTVEDNAILLAALAGHDRHDPYSAARDPEVFDRDLGRGVRGGTVGIPVGFYYERLEEEVGARVAQAAEVYRDLGANVREVEVPHLRETLDAQRLVLAAEAYAVHEERFLAEPEKFDEEVRERVEAGARPKAYEYANAQRAKLRSLRAFSRAFEEVDVLLTPTVPIPATLGRATRGKRRRYGRARPGGAQSPHRADQPQRPTEPLRPCGYTCTGLPVGMQLIGPAFGEATLYRYGHAYESAQSTLGRR